MLFLPPRMCLPPIGVIIIFSGGSFFFNPSSFPHFLENSKWSSDLSYFAFIKGERSGLFDDILTILSPFTYRKGTITYFPRSEYNQVFTLWRFNIVGKSFCLWVLHRRMHPIQCNFWAKNLTGQYRLRKYTHDTLRHVSFMIFQGEVTRCVI